ncbi:MAG: DUF378 domain-containing protein [Candidatus Gracilibacteria bacterium]|nr:DUF378 domain-containing protein [Candidatus Gracilibacteria bacterium]MDD5178712.1 DUF378 domain-containing protein [Candidatus Gracilibacteria bacterium]
MKFNLLGWIAFSLIVIGGINWGLVGLIQFDIVSWLFGKVFPLPILAVAIYVLIGLSALYLGVKALANQN